MDSSTDSFEEIEESMLELVQRAEAFLSAFPSTSASSSSGSVSSSINQNSSTHASDDSFSTASSLSSIYTSHDSSLADSSVFSDGSQSDLSSISGASSSSGHRALHPINPTALFGGDTTSPSNSSTISGIRTSSGNSALHSLNASGSSSGSAVSSLRRNFSEDCILVPGSPVPVVDLCSPWVVYPRNLLRQLANSAPVVDSITLDDTINEPVQRAAPVPSAIRPPEELPQPAAVVNEYRDGPPAKRSKEGAVLNLSQSTDGDAGKDPAIALICPICFDSIFTKRAASTICGHLFCHECISQEIKVRKQCPLCKRKLARNHVHPIYCP